ncbi:MAG: hypothetical protein GX622_06990 [Bacteroidales bacterium]|jgi:signal transduction histidine kinase|nr:hypothetical protein [Bacteroidales bacterium]
MAVRGKKERKTTSAGGQGHDGSRRAAAQLAEMAGGIAHDLNTVITTIYGFSEQALESAGEQSGTATHIRKIISAADRVKMLTARLLSLSRRAADEKVTVRVTDILSDTIEFVKPSIPPGIKIIRKISAPEATIETIPVQLFRIFLNLIMNAVQAIEKKKGNIEITVDGPVNNKGNRPGKNDSFLLIRITDTGKGMDGPTIEKMFEPYFTKGSEQGTGLGLTVVNDALKDMGGTITVRSAQGHGTTVDMIIPHATFGAVSEKD